MDQLQPPLQPPPGPDQASALRSYFTSQGEQIGELHGMLYVNPVTRVLFFILSLLLEIAMYIGFAVGIWFSVMLPLNPFATELEAQRDLSILVQPHLGEIESLMVTVKIIVAAVAMLLLLCGILLWRVRSKNTKLKRAFLQADRMKMEFAEARSRFGF
jgi:hypothetical protein